MHEPARLLVAPSNTNRSAWAYVKISGRCPFCKWADENTNLRMKNKATKLLMQLCQDSISKRKFCHVRDGVYRIKFSLQDRVLLFKHENRWIVSHWFRKKTEGCPKKETDLVVKRKNDYLSRLS